jgi:hypothetical protein
MSVLEKLTEGIVERSLKNEGAALLEKWERTGLLEGLDNDNSKNGMARLLENQASQLLKEASSMAGGDVQGFASVAFPLVRRVFGGLIANDLVSVQPMSLPSGLIFFLDFQYTDTKAGITAGESLYGGGIVASQVTGGVTDLLESGGGFYNLQSGYSSPTGSQSFNSGSGADGGAGGVGGGVGAVSYAPLTASATVALIKELAGTSAGANQLSSLRWDADLLEDSTNRFLQVTCSIPGGTGPGDGPLNRKNLIAITSSALSGFAPNPATIAMGNVTMHRRLTKIVDVGGTEKLVLVLSKADAWTATSGSITLQYPVADEYAAAGAVGAVVGDVFPLEGATEAAGDFDSKARNQIPEIDIKVDSVSVTAMSKKLKAKWSPELGQDLNAYHNLDAEVELTQILSEQIALEIDREIVNDLIQDATAGTYYWSRSPGLFVNRTTGQEIGANTAAPDFTGTVSEWYETLVETVNDVSAQIHRKTLRGGANFLVTSPEVANILEFTAGFRANVTADADRGTVGAVNVGSISKKWDLWVDPYFPRNLVLVGRKGGSFLESGYVYAPYVPLQVTPTIFGTEDFVPRKGVMTRYAKKMVRPDMYGLVVVRGLLGESGA